MIVVKIGGSPGVDLDAVCDDAARLVHESRRLVIVHGGSDATNTLAERLGCPPRFITSPSGHTSRRTDRETLGIFQMACRGVMNQRIVQRLQARAVNAVGLSGMDGRLWEGARKAAVRSVENGRVVIVRDDYTGTVERINVGLLRTLMDAGCTPVISPPAISVEHEPINVDADRAAAQTAAALGAEELLLLSNVPGLLRRFPDESSLVPRVSRAALDDAVEWAQGRMKKKVLGAGEALCAGVGRVVIGDARARDPISRALSGAGTVFQ
ncbi:MAG: [LysW]-aminoadipate kinase [Leptolyngbya sp. PLA2]|nr:[LysW]-aminoadipate kinase [Leptolyngbya sp.]MCE7972179.1 [LysW]-aminoadipate kinase [Leptolyngbya sp. PL-A2]MCQ3941244.1 [LysW]-aminoadipate kinase [cyanobacterium CYA1]MCZ7633293.1 [LysW]-aminoadipate kinase [Phycisphaerales bacterium]MDL1905529.1 [LysW]-aminoadipate kinase [Synechococcales cyanobacterium CNB]